MLFHSGSCSGTVESRVWSLQHVLWSVCPCSDGRSVTKMQSLVREHVETQLLMARWICDEA